jgi:PIN domain nuclease of toxin-antitoxin system
MSMAASSTAGSSGAAASSILLDTCAAIYLAEGTTIASSAREAIVSAALRGAVLVSAVSAWEIGLLAARRRIQFLPNPETWFERLVGLPGIRLAALSPAIAIASSFLPEPLHGDPADRLLIATARSLGVPVVTRDRLILDYAEAGHVQAVVC